MQEQVKSSSRPTLETKLRAPLDTFDIDQKKFLSFKLTSIIYQQIADTLENCLEDDEEETPSDRRRVTAIARALRKGALLCAQQGKFSVPEYNTRGLGDYFVPVHNIDCLYGTTNGPSSFYPLTTLERGFISTASTDTGLSKAVIYYYVLYMGVLDMRISDEVSFVSKRYMAIVDSYIHRVKETNGAFRGVH